MGCLKLSYYQTYSNRKVLYSDCVLESKSAQMWLSVDPMSDKYPNMSPYNYCANNPVILVDPDGREVEYNSLADRLIIGVAIIFDSEFRKQFKELKKSEETYVFNGKIDPDSGGGCLTTDGEKLYINYNRGKDAEQGTNTFTNLRHESEHAVQFEYGEFGFELIGIGEGITDRDGNYFEFTAWSAQNSDLDDEMGARDAGYCGFISDPTKDNIRNWWNSDATSIEEKRASLRNAGYSGETPLNNTNTERIKTKKEYKLPHRERPN